MMRISPQWLLMKWNCVIRRKTAVIAIKDGNIPKTSVVFMRALRLLNEKRDIQYAVRMVRMVPNRQLIAATNSVLANHCG